VPRIDWVREVERPQSVRAMQLAGMFDIPPERKLRRSWSVNLPLDERDWNVGLVVGPSGCGKTSLLEELGANLSSQEWTEACLLDDFPADMSIKDIIGLLCAVGFSSPPDWMKPFGALSNGEQFRVNLARSLAETSDGVTYIDEFTSVVDRQVAQVASAALAKTARREKRQVVAASCHYDILEWLSPDWVCEPHSEDFHWRDGLQRPAIDLTLQRVHHSAWKIFAPYHYLSADLNTSARCFVAYWDGRPVAWSSALPFIGRLRGNRKMWREHRTVCLPDFQGIGIGTRVSNVMGAMLKALDIRWTSTTSHPAMITHRQRSGEWATTRKPSFTATSEGGKLNRMMNGGKSMARAGAAGRLTQAFEYIGPAWPDAAEAKRVWDGV
jgi:energy-coupling factor transporter ATP-binding protein EcfA2/GNAT superfamily N-acetyltransferase